MSRNSGMSNVIHSITSMNNTDVIYSDTNRIMLLFYDYNSLCIWPCNEDAKDESMDGHRTKTNILNPLGYEPLWTRHVQSQAAASTNTLNR